MVRCPYDRLLRVSMRWHSTEEYAGVSLSMPVGTPLINNLLHFMFAWEAREVVGSGSVD